VRIQIHAGQVLKGVFSRDSLSLTSEDVGIGNYSDSAATEPGQLRLLMLGRSDRGYANLDQAIPPLRDLNDGLIETCKILLAAHAQPDRPRQVGLLIDGLRAQTRPATVPLLTSLERRSLLAAQTLGGMEGVLPPLTTLRRPSASGRQKLLLLCSTRTI
jgi:hypothetical protein